MTTSKKYFSNKRTAQQTISTSPAIKEWIARYVNVNHKKNPDDLRFKSISNFYNYIMENMLKLFEEGKTLDDLKRVQDKKVKDFFKRFSFNATIPLYEMAVEPNKFTPFSFEFNTRFLLKYLDLFKSETKSKDYKDFELFFEKLRSRYAKTNVTKDMRLELIPGKNNKPGRGTLEYIGKYKNLHFENCKFFAAMFGILGARITDFFYSPDDLYCRIEILETNLVYNDDLAKKERLKLLEENIDYIINYNRMLDENDMYLWMKLAEDNGTFISFKNKRVFNKWIRNVENHLQKFGTREDFLKKILFFFQKLHWIKIVNDKDLSFQIEQSLEKEGTQAQWLLKYLSKHSTITQNEDTFSFENEI
ncbi:MAG: hypothetical protein ACXAES_05810 [Promethearchaeota archaeon]|jgi:hypothetical protein